MRITYDSSSTLDLIYIYLREFDGIIVDTIPNLRANLFFDEKNNWIGIEVFNDFFREEKIDIPILKKSYTPSCNEKVELNDNRIFILFSSETSIYKRLEVDCNIDFNSINGLQGIELILPNLNCKMDIAKNFIHN